MRQHGCCQILIKLAKYFHDCNTWCRVAPILIPAVLEIPLVSSENAATNTGLYMSPYTDPEPPWFIQQTKKLPRSMHLNILGIRR